MRSSIYGIWEMNTIAEIECSDTFLQFSSVIHVEQESTLSIKKSLSILIFEKITINWICSYCRQVWFSKKMEIMRDKYCGFEFCQGNFASAVIWKIQGLFWSLFKLTCSCIGHTVCIRSSGQGCSSQWCGKGRCLI